MNRLTMRNSDGTYSQPTHTTFEKMFCKLAEFEDFMEDMGFEDLEHLKLRLKNLTNGAKYYSIWLELKEWLYKDITNGEYYFKVMHRMQELEDRQ